MKGMLTSLLLHPDTFFGERMKEPEDLKIPGIIVLIGAIIAAVGTYLLSGIYEGLYIAAAGEGLASLLGIFGAISAFFVFSILIWWVILSGIFYLLSMAFAGTGTFRRTLECAGYGLVPVIIGSFITAPHIVLLSSYDRGPGPLQHSGSCRGPAFHERDPGRSGIQGVYTVIRDYIGCLPRLECEPVDICSQACPGHFSPERHYRCPDPGRHFRDLHPVYGIYRNTVPRRIIMKNGSIVVLFAVIACSLLGTIASAQVNPEGASQITVSSVDINPGVFFEGDTGIITIEVVNNGPESVAIRRATMYDSDITVLSELL